MCLLLVITAFAVGACEGAITPERVLPHTESVVMPRISLGHPDGDKLNETAALELWLSKTVGGVGIDTAYDYNNQQQIRAALAASGRARESVFLTTKIPGCVGYDAALKYIRDDLEQLGMDYVDLVLIHFPLITRSPPVPASSMDIVSTWRALEDAVTANLTRAIGVSNFNSTHLTAILQDGGAFPAVNQCQLSVGVHDDETIQFCKKFDILYESYSPLGRGGDFPGCNASDPRISAIAQAHGKTFAQVCMRWIVQQDFCVAVSSTSVEHQQEDLDIFDFTLSDEEMRILSSI